MGRSLMIAGLLAGMLMGCSDPMYPQPKLPPIVIPAYVPPPPVDRSLLTIVLPSSLSDGKEKPQLGRMRTKAPFNVQWESLPEHRLRDGKQDDAHFAGVAFYVRVLVPQSNGRERIARTSYGQPEKHDDGKGRWSYRLAMTAPDNPGSYVVRLSTSDITLSESILEVVAGDEPGR